MSFVAGRIAKLLRDPCGQINGILLDGGKEIRFPMALGLQAAPVFDEGCLVEIQGNCRSQNFPNAYLEGEFIRNLDSGQTLALPAPKREGKPGMQSDTTPTDTASLALPEPEAEPQMTNPALVTDSEGAFAGSMPAHTNDASLVPGSYFHRLEEEASAFAGELVKNEAAHSIGLAYDSLHQIQAILAYLHIMRHRVPGIGQFLDEAKHTYEQALSRFAAGDHTSAKEFAEASASLSSMVQIVMTRTLRADNTLPSLVPPPPEHLDASPQPKHVEEDLAQAETLLSRIQWLLENGTLPSEERAQVRKLASWGHAFYKQAQHTYREAVLDDAAEFARAALAGAYSAEHICRNWYVRHSLHP